MDFISITYDGSWVTSRMPADESLVEIRLKDGTLTKAFFSCNIMEAGDWDFIPVDEDDEPGDGESLAASVVAWRYLEEEKT